MARHCANCGAALKTGDKFCGECGAVVEPAEAATASVPKPAAMQQPPQPASTLPPQKRSGGSIVGGIVLGLLVGGGAVLAGTGYYSGWFETKTAAPATDEPGTPQTASSETLPAADTAQEEPGEPSAELSAGPAATEPEIAQSTEPATFLKPGQWSFQSEVTSALVQGTTIPARPNGRNLVGHKRSFSGCISEDFAKRPAEKMLLAQVGYGKDCRHQKATMANGKYEGTMMCPQPPDGAGFQVRLVGDYNQTNINMTVFSTMTIGQGVNEAEGKVQANLVAMMNGRYVGPCK